MARTTRESGLGIPDGGREPRFNDQGGEGQEQWRVKEGYMQLELVHRGNAREKLSRRKEYKRPGHEEVYLRFNRAKKGHRSGSPPRTFPRE